MCDWGNKYPHLIIHKYITDENGKFILKNDMSDAAQKTLFSANVPILPIQEVPIQLSGNLITIDKNTLEIIIEKGQTEIANMKQQERLDWLETLVDAYKHDRTKSTQNNN